VKWLAPKKERKRGPTRGRRLYEREGIGERGGVRDEKMGGRKEGGYGSIHAESKRGDGPSLERRPKGGVGE